jgi:hypothetical protein
MTAPPLTPAGHRAAAEKALDTMRPLPPGSATYDHLAKAAIAHALLAAVAYLEPPPAQDIPGLPPGWQLTASRAKTGEQLWGYKLTPPDGSTPVTNRHRWGTWGMAMNAGIDAAAKIMAGKQDHHHISAPDGARWDPRSGMDDQALRDNGIRG